MRYSSRPTLPYFRQQLEDSRTPSESTTSILCLGLGGETTKTAQADRAKHPNEFWKVDSNLKIGKYLALRIL